MKTTFLFSVALGLALIAAVLAWTPGALAQRAAASNAVSPSQPAIYMVNLTGKIGWDLTPDVLTTLFADADRTFNDLVHVPDAAPGEANQVVDSDAWANHVVVLRLDLVVDDRATQLDPRESVEEFRRVLGEQMDLRSRRVALWVRRAEDVAAMMLPVVPEVVLVPGARVSMSPEFVERLTANDRAAEVGPIDTSALRVCATQSGLVDALGLPEGDTPMLSGDAQKILDRWADFRDRALELAERAVGEQWDEYVLVIEDPDSPRHVKMTARRDMQSALRRAHMHLARYDDMAVHPVFVPLREQVLARTKEFAETPRPTGPRSARIR